LNRSAHHCRLGNLARYGAHVLLKAKRKIELRLAKDPGEAAGKQPGKRSREHAADQKRPHHQDERLMARKAQEVAAVMDKFVYIHTRENGCRTLLRANEIER
jgi:hypothetical protein